MFIETGRYFCRHIGGGLEFVMKKMKRRGMLLFVTLIIFALLNSQGAFGLPEVGTAVANPFQDISETDWFYNSVMFVYSRSLMLGTSTEPMMFSPNEVTDRGMIVTILYRLTGSPDTSSLNNPFNDVADDMWYAAAVKWAVSNEIVSGYGDGRYGPEDEITREQVAVILNNYIRYGDRY